jgi:hypothetical protein
MNADGRYGDSENILTGKPERLKWTGHVIRTDSG